MNRKVNPCQASIRLIEPFNNIDMCQWIIEQCKTDKYNWLLIHSLEGVLWGKFDHDQNLLKFALPNNSSSDQDEVQRSLLQYENIIQLRLFCTSKELFLWRTHDDKLRGRIIEESQSTTNSPFWTLYIDEEHFLWGNDNKKVSSECTQLTEAGKGLEQFVPIEIVESSNNRNKRLKLKIRNYLEEMSDSGQVILSCGRLTDLSLAKE